MGDIRLTTFEWSDEYTTRYEYNTFYDCIRHCHISPRRLPQVWAFQLMDSSVDRSSGSINEPGASLYSKIKPGESQSYMIEGVLFMIFLKLTS